MHFIDAWTSLPPFEVLLLLVPVALVIVSLLIPARAVARALAVMIAGAVWLMPGLDPNPVRAAWCGIWVLVAAVISGGAPRDRAAAPRPIAVESGLVGLLLGGALFVLLVVAVGRQNLPAEPTRHASVGFLLVAAGLAHLMLRRDVRRAVMSFAILGFGIQVLERAASLGTLEGSGVPLAAAPLATTIAVLLTTRAAIVRQRDAGSAWVSQAHDLHD
jgi:hypothetical protein